MGKQFSEEKGDKMSALPAMVGGLSVNVPVGTVRRTLTLAELSGSDTVAITTSLERLVSLAQTVSCLVGQQSVREAATLPAHPVKPVTEEERRVTLKHSTVLLESKELVAHIPGTT